MLWGLHRWVLFKVCLGLHRATRPESHTGGFRNKDVIMSSEVDVLESNLEHRRKNN